MKEIIEQIQNSKQLIITSHLRPDYDAVCSALAFYLFAKRYNPNVKVILEGLKEESFSFLHKFEEIEWVENLPKNLSNADLVVFLDARELRRFTNYVKELEAVINNKQTICIDHHPQRLEGFDYEIIEENSSATCEIIFKHLYKNLPDTSPEEAELLAVGILGDTGSLRFVWPENVSVLSTIQQLVLIGNLDLEDLYLKINSINTKDFEVFQQMVQNTKTVQLPNCKQGLMYTYMPDEFTAEETKAMKTFFAFTILRQVKGFPWGFVVSREENGKYNISFRTSPGSPNVRLICEDLFSGGGHDRTAGGELAMTNEVTTTKQAAEKIIKLLETYNFTYIQ